MVKSMAHNTRRMTLSKSNSWSRLVALSAEVGIVNLVRRKKRGRLGSVAVSLLRKVARRDFVIPLIGTYVGSKLVQIGETKTAADTIRLLVLNEERFRADLEVLARRPDVELYSLPSSVQHLVNAIWVSDIREISVSDPDAYLRNEHAEIRRIRRCLHVFLTKLIAWLADNYKLDGITTCAFYYRQDREWESAGREIGVSFFVLHKENMKDPVTHTSTIARYKRKAFRFTGDRLFLFNKLEKEVILKAGCAEESQISIVGGLRMDSLYKRVEAEERRQLRKRIVLFSTHHRLGLLEIPCANSLFNPRRDAGFINHFNVIHGTLASLAVERPDIEFVIKAKWFGIWYEEIVSAIKGATGLTPDRIPNLTITEYVPAQDLIFEAAVVIGMNSTTLLEAKLAGVPVIVPLFEEAANKYFETNVYFQKYLDIFAIAHSADQLREMMLQAVEGNLPKQDAIPRAMIEEYLGFFDGQVADRVVAIMKDDIDHGRSRRKRVHQGRK